VEALQPESANALDVRHLSVAFTNRTSRGRRRAFRAVDDVSIAVGRGEIVGIVGESGSGKSTLAMSVAGLRRPTEGEIRVAGEPLARTMSRSQRAAVQVVFQDPLNSLDPRQSIGSGLAELRTLHPDRTRWATDEEILARVGLPTEVLNRLPRQISGGQAQRVSIARALLLRPEIVVADEPTSALDVLVQAQILKLLRELQERDNLTILMISHNLAVVEAVCDRVYVMLNGRVVEEGASRQVLGDPQNAYTQRLVRSLPRLPDSAWREES